MKSRRRVPDPQQVFHVEKFIPTHCPKCGNDFQENTKEGFFLVFRGIQKKVLEGLCADGFGVSIIECGKCHNLTTRFIIEERWYETIIDAKAAVKRDGFRNLRESYAGGNHRVRGVRVERKKLRDEFLHGPSVSELKNGFGSFK